MSYDIYLVHPETDATLELDHPSPTGGTYSPGSPACWLNVTYNYSKHYYPLFALEFHNTDRGIRTLYGMSGEDSIPILERVIARLTPDNGGYSYWDATEGNARRALEALLTFAKAHPEGVWRGD